MPTENDARDGGMQPGDSAESEANLLDDIQIAETVRKRLANPEPSRPGEQLLGELGYAPAEFRREWVRRNFRTVPDKELTDRERDLIERATRADLNFDPATALSGEQAAAHGRKVLEDALNVEVIEDPQLPPNVWQLRDRTSGWIVYDSRYDSLDPDLAEQLNDAAAHPERRRPRPQRPPRLE